MPLPLLDNKCLVLRVRVALIRGSSPNFYCTALGMSTRDAQIGLCTNDSNWMDKDKDKAYRL